jgi:predicted outer membrane repeat protein
MSLSSWLRNWTSTRAPRSRAPHRRATSRFRPQLEGLDDRCLLSILTVTNTLDSGHGSLRYEIAHAGKNKDTIVFAPNLSGQTITLTSGELDITKSLTIQGPGKGQLTISGGGASRVFKVESNLNVNLSGLTISDADGVAVAGSSTAFDGEGGGILSLGTLTVSGCTLSGNSASFGGGIDNAGTLTVSGCMLSGNVASIDGGGVYNGSTAVVTKSTLSGNSATDLGGGINNGPGAALTVSGCTLSGNSAFQGGGMYVNGTGTVSSCTLSGNSAVSQGGGIYGGVLTVDGCSLSGNSAGSQGGGIYESSLAGETLTVSNSMFTANTPDNIFGPFTDGGGNTFS